MGKIILQIQNSTILTNQDWVQFKHLFEQVHTGYITRLKKAFPLLTPSEVRFIVLAKLKFSNKEMASMLGVSPKSLNVTWYRIRKKLGLSGKEKADEFAEMI